MTNARQPAATIQQPWFITEPGQTDWLTVFTGGFLLCFVVTVAVLMIRLLYVPLTSISSGEKAKYEVVGALSLLAIVSPGNYYWIAAVLIASIDIPDFAPVFRRITAAVERIAENRSRSKPSKGTTSVLKRDH